MQSQNIQDHESESRELENYPPQWVSRQPVYTLEEVEINLLDYWRIIWRRKWFMLAIFLIAMGASLLITFLTTPKYTSMVSLLPVSSKSSGGISSLAAQLTEMPLVGSGLSGLTDKLGGSKSKELINILKSRTLTEKIIERFNLMPVLFSDQWDEKKQEFHTGFPAFLKPIPVIEDGVEKFQNKVAKIKTEKKSGLITVKVTLKDPELAARVSNGMVVELARFINQNALTQEKRNRIFIEEQMVKNQAKLLKAGKQLNQFYSDGRISSVAPEVNVDVGSYEPIEKIYKEFRNQLESLGPLEDNIADQKVKEEVRGVPGQVYRQYLALNEKLLIQNHGFLSQQYELAKIEEAKEDLAFNVLDKGRVMVRTSTPKLILNLLIGGITGIFLALFFAFFLEYLRKLKAKEAHL